jgi:hypothetical protein
MAIREGAALELPHILVLIDDPDGRVIEPIQSAVQGTKPLYDFDLMLGSGHLTGYGLLPSLQESVIAGFRALAKPEAFRNRYGLDPKAAKLLFAMGDGNHSLATAKAVWEQMKAGVGMQHPARYALVEIENVHDEGLEFAPIHRILFGLKSDLWNAMQTHFGDAVVRTPLDSFDGLMHTVDRIQGSEQTVGLVQGLDGEKYGLIRFTRPASSLPVGTLQAFLDDFLKQGGAQRIDYVHGSEIVDRLGGQVGNAGFYLPPMGKSSLFRTVILDGALPRKTFSMGAAREKRFYMEARKIA